MKTPSGKATKAAALLRAFPSGLTPDELAEGLGVPRAAVGRIVATLSTSTPLLAYAGRWRLLEGNDKGNDAPP